VEGQKPFFNCYSISAALPPTQVSPIAQGIQQEQSSSDIFIDIPNAQGDFVLNQAPSINQELMQHCKLAVKG
jgi:hypothetical protein